MAAKRQDVTEDSLISELEEARGIAAVNGQSGAMVAATMGKARITGHIIERKETGAPGDFERMSEDELRAFIKERMPQAIADSEQTEAQAVSQANADSDSESVSSVLLTRLPPPTHGGSGTTQ